jgi:hypothetical protein
LRKKPHIRSRLGSKGPCNIPYKTIQKAPKISPKCPFFDSLYGKLKSSLRRQWRIAIATIANTPLPQHQFKKTSIPIKIYLKNLAILKSLNFSIYRKSLIFSEKVFKKN